MLQRNAGLFRVAVLNAGEMLQIFRFVKSLFEHRQIVDFDPAFRQIHFGLNMNCKPSRNEPDHADEIGRVAYKRYARIFVFDYAGEQCDLSAVGCIGLEAPFRTEMSLKLFSERKSLVIKLLTYGVNSEPHFRPSNHQWRRARPAEERRREDIPQATASVHT